MMDEVGVLVESIEYRALMKSAPMVGVKPKPKSNFPAGGTTDAPPPLSSSFSLSVDKLDAIFRSDFKNNKTEQPLNLLGEDDVFASPVPISHQYKGIDLENVLNNASNRTNDHNPNSGNLAGSNEYDLLGLQSKQTYSGDDQVIAIEKQGNKESVLEDLIPGFEVAPPSDKGVESKIDLAPESNGSSIKSNSTLENDSFVVFEPSLPQSDASWPFAGPTEQVTEKDSIRSSFDELDDFVKGRDPNDSRTDGNWTATNTPSAGLASNGFENVDDLDTFFRGGVEEKNAARPTSKMQDSQFDFISGEDKGAEGKQNSSPATNIGDLLGDVTTSSEEFRETEGEPEERRRARLTRHMRMNARVAEALAAKNQRDLQNQHEQDEKHRLSETLDNDIKSWSQGREGNLRALLSSLQQVLWPECNWRPVSLADLMTSDSVKKAYKKATLYVHPDKVQQKGANIQQKYIAEKVFDLLQEAWIRFSSEELSVNRIDLLCTNN